MNSPLDTIVAIATPLGEGGIGVIRMSGPKAIEVAEKLFQPKKSIHLAEAPSHTCYYGDVKAAGSPLTIRGDDKKTIDQAILTVFRAPHSYTGDDVIEISAHGSPFILHKILALCTTAGARLAGPGEFTERAFLNGKMDLTQAEAVAELIRAKTDKSHAAARAQLDGSLARTVGQFRERLLPLLAHLEVGLDHADEDHSFLDRPALQTACEHLTGEIAAVLASAQTGKVLREGYRVTLMGRPNAGKSSLMNLLLKEDRAIVTPVAGTTRDTLEETLNLQGIPIILTDTAGLRSSTLDPVEQIGIQRSRIAADQADMIIGLFDGSEDFGSADQDVLSEASRKPHVWVINKTDLPARLFPKTLQDLNGGGSVVAISAKTGEGIDQLRDLIRTMALAESALMGEAQWLLNTRHVSALQRAQEALTMAAGAARDGSPEECVALELKTALNALGEIIGATSTEDLLGEIFSRFCIGK